MYIKKPNFVLGAISMDNNDSTNKNNEFENFPGLLVTQVSSEIDNDQYILIEDLVEKQNNPTLEVALHNNFPLGRKEARTAFLMTPAKMTKGTQKTKNPVRILPKTPIMLTNVKPKRTCPDVQYDFSTIKKTSTVWKCSICQTMSTTRKLALDHLKAAHTNKSITK